MIRPLPLTSVRSEPPKNNNTKERQRIDMRNTNTSDNHQIEIPIGHDPEGKSVSLFFSNGARNHYYITGGPGSGKSYFLKAMVNSAVKKYDSSNLAIWGDFAPEDIEKSWHSLLDYICLPEQNHVEREISIIDRAYEEVQKRCQILAKENVSSYLQTNSFPFLLVIIDELRSLLFLDLDNEYGSDYTEKLMTVLRMSHAVGVSIICTSQLPIDRMRGFTGAMIDLFNVRIALEPRDNNIYEYLSVSPSELSREDNEVIRYLSLLCPGDFVLVDRYGSRRACTGRVEL